MPELHPLLELQHLDLASDQLRARRAALPERAACAAREAEIGSLDRLRSDAEARLAALGAEERKAEALVADLAARTREVEKRLYSGEIKAIKELEALQHELRECQRRQADQEGAELALMEQEERASTESAELLARREALAAELAALRAKLAAAEGALDAELARLHEGRSAAAARLEAPLVARYEMLRASPPIKGRAALRFSGDTCDGCRSALPIAFVSGLNGQPSGTTAACPRCGRILVL
jgi:predicted  nucleic acid-binding Zn-ribbon protein